MRVKLEFQGARRNIGGQKRKIQNKENTKKASSPNQVKF
jgi:hypothetical protein